VAFGNMIFNSRIHGRPTWCGASRLTRGPAAWDLTGLDSYPQQLDIN
jgi:hypothetical protein